MVSWAGAMPAKQDSKGYKLNKINVYGAFSLLIREKMLKFTMPYLKS